LDQWFCLKSVPADTAVRGVLMQKTIISNMLNEETSFLCGFMCLRLNVALNNDECSHFGSVCFCRCSVHVHLKRDRIVFSNVSI